MYKKIILLFLLFPLLVNAEEKKESMDEIIGMMVVAKATGMCGALLILKPQDWGNL
jgi:hypothetical protein